MAGTSLAMMDNSKLRLLRDPHSACARNTFWQEKTAAIEAKNLVK
jgi:hypothetical protein